MVQPRRMTLVRDDGRSLNNIFFDKWKENSNIVKFHGSEVIGFHVLLLLLLLFLKII